MDENKIEQSENIVSLENKSDMSAIKPHLKNMTAFEGAGRDGVSDSSLETLQSSVSAYEQKKQDNRERQARFRAKHPERFKGYRNPEKYPLEPLPTKTKKEREPRLAKNKPYTEEEKAARREYMANYRAKIQEALKKVPNESGGSPSPIN